MIITKTPNGIKLSLKKDHELTQNQNDLQKIWDRPSYYDELYSKTHAKSKENISVSIGIDPEKTLYYLTDCTNWSCYFNRYKYRTRDVAKQFLMDELKTANLNKINVVFFNSFMLLTELFYLMEIIKNNYKIQEIHLVDPCYEDVVNKLKNNDYLNLQTYNIIYYFHLDSLNDKEKEIKTNTYLIAMYQFLEFFYANNNPIEIYIHDNPISFAKINKNRINLTIEVDSNLYDDGNSIAVSICNMTNSVNIYADWKYEKVFGFEPENVYIQNYKCYHQIEDKNLDFLETFIDKKKI